jgi:hypothetical protein
MDHVSDWSPCETTTHQDHVVAHVIGATVLGSFVAGEAAHLLLDIGFLWTIYLDGEMNLLPQGVAIAELDGVTSADKTELAFDAQLLLNEGREARGLKRFSGATVDCLITAVELFGSDALRRVVIRGEGADIEIDTSLESGQVTVRSDSHIE